MEQILQHYSYLGLFLIIMVEEAGLPLPIPGDLFIAAVSALPGANYSLVVSSVTIGTLLGSTVLFTLAQKFGHKFVMKFGKYVRFTPERVKKVEKWFKKHGGLAIVFGRLVPGFRTITPMVAGIFELDYKTFWLYTAIAAFIWANIFFFVGKFFGNLIISFIH